MSDVLLVIDRETGLTDEVAQALDGSDVRVLRASAAEEAFEHLEWGWVDVVVCTPEMPGADGFDLVPQLRRRHPRLAIAFASEAEPGRVAAEALERGVSETLPRPIQRGALQLMLSRVQEHQRVRRTNGLLRRELRRALGEQPVVAASRSMISVLEAVEHATQRSGPILLRGEPGTGKEAVARAIHAQSPRHEAPFVALSCASAAETYIESELFGRGRGDRAEGAPARRGLLVETRGGTLYLDELGGLSRRLQARLAGAMSAQAIEIPRESRSVEIDVRVIASTQRDLVSEAKAGRFDDDLIALFDATPLVVPPLRERREDIPLLADAFLEKLRLRHGRHVRDIADTALDALTRYGWPGNVRELESTLDRATLLANGDRIELRDLPDGVQDARGQVDGDIWALRPARHAAETVAIRRALRATGGNRTHAARLLRISQRALLYKIKDYGIRD
jgi:two-component system response regulator AtoC